MQLFLDTRYNIVGKGFSVQWAPSRVYQMLHVETGASQLWSPFEWLLLVEIGSHLSIKMTRSGSYLWQMNPILYDFQFFRKQKCLCWKAYEFESKKSNIAEGKPTQYYLLI